MRSVLHRYENAFCATLLACLPSETIAWLDALLRPPDPTEASGNDDEPNLAPALLALRSGTGQASLQSVGEEAAKLTRIRSVNLPAGLFDGVPSRMLLAYCRWVGAEELHELRRYPDPIRRAAVARWRAAPARTGAVARGPVEQPLPRRGRSQALPGRGACHPAATRPYEVLGRRAPSSMPLDAKLFAYAVRYHWHVENRLHWVLDAVFHEGLSRLRSGTGPQNMATVRHMAMYLLRGPKDKHSLKVRRKSAAWDTNYLEALLRQLA